MSCHFGSCAVAVNRSRSYFNSRRQCCKATAALSGWCVLLGAVGLVEHRSSVLMQVDVESTWHADLFNELEQVPAIVVATAIPA